MRCRPLMDRSARHAVICNKPAVMKRVLEFVAASRNHLREVLVFPRYHDAAVWIGVSDRAALLLCLLADLILLIGFAGALAMMRQPQVFIGLLLSAVATAGIIRLLFRRA